jgi:hypothetical protein
MTGHCRHPLLLLHRKCPAEAVKGSRRKSFHGGPDHRRTSREGGTGESQRQRWRSSIRLMERFADARSHPMQPGATIALLVSNRQDVLQLISLWALLTDVRTRLM